MWLLRWRLPFGAVGSLMQVSLHIVPDLAKLGHEECHHIKDAGMK